jgi:hypothetical protein
MPSSRPMCAARPRGWAGHRVDRLIGPAFTGMLLAIRRGLIGEILPQTRDTVPA